MLQCLILRLRCNEHMRVTSQICQRVSRSLLQVSLVQVTTGGGDAHQDNSYDSEIRLS